MTMRDVVLGAIDCALVVLLFVGIMHAGRFIAGGRTLPAIKSETPDGSVVTPQYVNIPNRETYQLDGGYNG